MRILLNKILVIGIIGLASIDNAWAANTPEPAIEWQPDVLKGQGIRKMDVQRGRLAVPENRANPDGRKIEIAVVRIPTTSKNPGSPIFMLAGGPGGSGIDLAGRYVSRYPSFLEIGDVIGVDQRGTGRSAPNLASKSFSYELPLNRPLDLNEAYLLIHEASQRAKSYWQSEGVDLTGYTTAESADDIDAVRQALAADKMNLVGRSYGTHLGLSIVRRHGQHVDRAVFIGVEGPDHTYKLPSQVQNALAHLDALVKADEQMGSVVPDLLGLVKQMLDRLETKPVTVSVKRGKNTFEVTIGKTDVQRWTTGQIGAVDGLVNIPAAYYQMASGDFSMVAADVAEQRTGSIRSAMFPMMDCASGATADRRKRIALESETCFLGDLINFPFPAICSAWGDPDCGDAFRGPIATGVNTLFVSGTLDARTPIGNADEVRAGFSNHHHVIVENAGHDGRLFDSEETVSLMREFLRGNSPTSNRIEFPPPRFRRPRVR